MQARIENSEQLFEQLKSSLSAARLTRYIKECGDDSKRAFELYYWNTKASQSLYVLVQVWEVALRNRLNSFLCWKYNKNWPFDEKHVVRQLQRADKARVQEAIVRQRQLRGTQKVSTDSVVADLSAGFWVSLLGKSYDVPYAWRYNLARVVPHRKELQRDDVSRMCDSLLDLRNRIAHHEPIYHLPLRQRWDDANVLLEGMCPAAHQFASIVCDFKDVMDSKPKLQL